MISTLNSVFSALNSVISTINDVGGVGRCIGRGRLLRQVVRGVPEVIAPYEPLRPYDSPPPSMCGRGMVVRASWRVDSGVIRR